MIDQQPFQEHLSRLCPDWRNRKYLLAVSGGIDSMVMLHLFHSCGLQIAVAHCNFQLRGDESTRDHRFVADAVHQLQCPLFDIKFDTKQTAQTLGLGIQETARKLRYDFFQETAATNQFDFIVTAHNRDDVVETLLMALNRKGSLSTLAGIRETENRLLRPMLEYSRKDIEDYAAKHMISYVEDSSNATNHYLRNKIRHKITPLLEEIMPGFSGRAAASVANLREYQHWFSNNSKQVLESLGDPFKEGIDLQQLKQKASAKLLLMQFLLTYGFAPSCAGSILANENPSEPMMFLSKQYQLFVHRNKMQLRPIEEETEERCWYIDEDLDTSHLPFALRMEITRLQSKKDLISPQNTAYLNPVEINFPLLVRKWNPGDRFIPFGMNEFKKVGDYFTDAKTTVAERNSAYVLCSGPDIVWLIGYRTDNRFMIFDISTDVLKLQLL